MKNKKPLKVLVTAGGTRVKIDAIRSIVNGSSGRFGTEIVKAFDRALRVSAEYSNVGLYFLGTKLCTDSVHVPFLHESFVYQFDLFDEYSEKLDKLLSEIQPDIVVLAAAVSDFAPMEETEGKISSDGDLTITFKPLPKLIATVRNKVPDSVICGFKCLDHASDVELIEAAISQIEKCGVDLVVANNWNTMKDVDHKIIIVKDTPIIDGYRGDVSIWSREFHDLASKVVEVCFEKYKQKNK